MSTGQVACTYAATILHDDGIPITAENIATLLKSANVAVEPYWPRLFAKLAEKTNLEDLIVNAAGSGGCSTPVAMPSPSAASSAAAPAVEEKKEELEEESDDDMPPINLFD